MHARTRLLALSLVACAFVADYAEAQALLAPSLAFVQVGTVKQTREATVGLAWDWGREWAIGPGLATGYWEASMSSWSYLHTGDRRRSWLAQVGLVPVLRYRLDAGASPWFTEAGIGVTLMTNVYETDRKRFSTSFNFGDHIAIGRNFGPRRSHEVALRLEHFSNAGIKEPNPGENFVQLRYSFRFE